MLNLLRTSIFVVGFCLASSPALASSGGAAGYSGREGVNCSACHSGGTGAGASFTGPTAVNGGTTVRYTFTVAGGTGVGGMNVAIKSAYARLKPADSTTYAFARDELYQSGTGTRRWNFDLEVPNVTGTIQMYGAGVASNGGTNGPTGLATLTINVTAAPGAPSVLTPAASNAPNGKTTTNKVTVTVLAGDDSPEAQLKYTWSDDIAGTTFSPNGTNAAKSSTATFTKPGKHTLTVNVTDPNNLSTPSSVVVEVTAALGGVALTPAEISLTPGSTQQFTAVATDQFGTALAVQPTLDWKILTGAGGGTISATGLYKAPNGPGTVVVSAETGGFRGSATVTIANGSAPKISTAPSAKVNGLSATLSAAATDDGGEAALLYTWSKVTGPGSITFAPNGTNAAKSTTATFSEAGAYKLELKVKDGSNLNAIAVLDVTAGGTSTTGPETGNPGTNPGPGNTTVQPLPEDTGGGCSSGNGQLALWAVLALLPVLAARRRSGAQR